MLGRYKQKSAACSQHENKMNARKETPKTGLPLLSHSNAVTHQDLHGSWYFVLNRHLFDRPVLSFCGVLRACANTTDDNGVPTFLELTLLSMGAVIRRYLGWLYNVHVHDDSGRRFRYAYRLRPAPIQVGPAVQDGRSLHLT